jgi:hypothetical protein
MTGNDLLWVAFWAVAALVGLVSALRQRPKPPDTEADELLRRSDMKLGADGLTTCAYCGTYCGQCNNASQHGLTLDQFKKRYGK